MYAALKGNGAVTRLVVLPHESHGYRARESVMHTLHEMETWLERFGRRAIEDTQRGIAELHVRDAGGDQAAAGAAEADKQ